MIEIPLEQVPNQLLEIILNKTYNNEETFANFYDTNIKDENVKENTVQEQPNVRELFGSVGKNDLKSFKEYLEENKDRVDQMVSLTRYNYSVTPTVYTKNIDKANKEQTLTRSGHKKNAPEWLNIKKTKINLIFANSTLQF